ncbi:transglutaminase-like cysteine peptidase [Bradyrhizobium tunisiense]|uniref:transglutaminase-like cysteine peptidase n=1 Tax=Bradyrhizobium tunisiense TaxID=3278709 RepID=UPI0035D7AD52
MKSRFGRQRTLAFAAVMLISLDGIADQTAFAAEVGNPQESAAEVTLPTPEAMQGPATFFTINAVLAKLDRERGRGPKALRLATLTPHETTLTDAATDGGPSSDGPSVGNEPFGLSAFRAPESLLWRKWRGVETDLAQEKIVLERCRSEAASCPAHVAQFLRLVAATKAKSGRAQLEEVNLGVNTAIRYVSDVIQFRELDRWSTPLATFASAKGDCEDYAIAKYVALREAGFPEADMRVLLVRDRAVRQDHAVLAARLDGRWLILDNRWSSLREDNGELNFTPLFAINHDGVQLFAKPYAKAKPNGAEMSATPAATATGSQWVGAEPANAGGAGALGTLPLLL